MIALDAGRAFNGGKPPAETQFRRRCSIPNPRKDAPPRTILGAEQKAWFKDQLRGRAATWKIWGNSLGAARHARRPAEPARRTDQEAVAGGHLREVSAAAITAAPTPSAARSTTSSATRRSPASRSSRATGTASGPAMPPPLLPPRKFEPVGLSFVGASLASPGAMEALEHRLPQGSSAAAAVPRRPASGASRTGPQHAAASTASALASNMPRASTSKRAHALSNPHLRRTLNSSTWAVTAMRRCGSPAVRCGPSSSASRARSRAASAPTAGRFATASPTSACSGNRASGPAAPASH